MRRRLCVALVALVATAVAASIAFRLVVIYLVAGVLTSAEFATALSQSIAIEFLAVHGILCAASWILHAL